jgi:phosphatidylserine/phosphatidylglycerophosphate/cardiolipin synthase-like enzyme
LETPLFCATAAGSGDHEVDLVALLRARLAAMSDLHVIIATPKRIPFGSGYQSFAQRFYLARNEAVASLRSVAPKRVAVYHPVGFPGRPEVIRSSVGIVDDVWALLGSSSFSRRGLTFDGSIDVVLVDKVIKRAVSDTVRNFRRQAIARTLGLVPPAPGETSNANWVRLNQQRSAFELVHEIVERGGDGLVEPLWPGLQETELLPVDRAIADPEGRGSAAVLGAFAELLASLGQDRV